MKKKYMKNPCWAGYKAYGTKMKNGKAVPNCVPVTEELGKDNEWGTPELTKKMMMVTPGQGKKLRSFKEFAHDALEYGDMEEATTPAWQRKEGKNPEGGLNKKGIASYRSQNPGSKLSLAVTKEPSKLKKGSKSWKRRKSFCARMKGMKKRLTSAETARDPDSRINKSLRKWNC